MNVDAIREQLRQHLDAMTPEQQWELLGAVQFLAFREERARQHNPHAVRLYRVIVPVPRIDEAAASYGRLLGMQGRRVSPGRHYFDCGGTILACYDAVADGDREPLRPNPGHLYLSVEDLTAALTRARDAGFAIEDDGVQVRPWGERSFYCHDPYGNPICFVDRETVFTG